MKKYFLLYFLFFFSKIIQAQLGSTIFVSGKNILGPCGDTLILRGINYAPYNWGWSPTQLRINEIALSGANCVRLVWYKTPATGTPTTTYTNLTNLDSVLSKCIQNKLIPILDLHDQTCQNNTTNLINMCTWYTQPAVKALINKYKHSLILNLANEALYVTWTSSPATAQTAFTNTYTTIINSIRANNITVPLMIDAPDCGQNLDVLTAVGNTLQTNDPQHNLIFSAHAYWYSFANNDSLTMLNKINSALAQNIPLVLGEIANTQDDVSMCQYTLNYKALLNICKNKKLSWLAWSWDNDGCSNRQVSSTGLAANLTTYGNEIMNNPNFGLLTNTSAKSLYLTTGACKIKIKAYHEGYYQASLHKMTSALLNQGITSPATITDSITLQLRTNTNPYAVLHATKTLWQSNGFLEATIPLSLINSNAYVALKHRNGIETWSANPVSIGTGISTTTLYDFTTQANKAYGSNQKLVEPSVYGIFTGDINQDSQVDAFDYILLDPLVIQGASGYLSADLNGDGAVDAFDYILLDANLIQGVGSTHP
jgi:mannan endo-1,4-beta-mannosidase